MSYSYADGDGLTALDKTTPNGAVEPVSNLDDAIRQVKAYLKDTTAGVAKIRTDLDSAMSDITALESADTTIGTDITSIQSDITSLQASVVELNAAIDGLVAQAGTAAHTAIVTNATTQQVVAGAGVSTINFDTKAIDSDNAFSVVTHKFTAALAGLYSLSVSLSLAVNSSGTPTDIVHTLEVHINGILASEVVRSVGTSLQPLSIELNRMYQLSSTNTVEVKYKAAVASGTLTMDVQANPLATIFQIVRVAS